LHRATSRAGPVAPGRRAAAAGVLARAAGGVWEAVTIATHDQSTVLDAATALSEAEIDDILATDHPWVPGPDGSTAPLRTDIHGNPCWDWGTGAAERAVRLVLRSLRTRIDKAAPDDRAELERRLTATSDSLQKVLAVRDALSEKLAEADLDLQPAGGAEAVAVALNDIFELLQVRRALGDELDALMKVVGPDVVETALEVEIVSRCTSARTPQQRSAPFQFLRLGPDIPLTLLDDLPEGSIANDLKDRILYGTQVGHFGAFGAADWRRWDWLDGAAALRRAPRRDARRRPGLDPRDPAAGARGRGVEGRQGRRAGPAAGSGLPGRRRPGRADDDAERTERHRRRRRHDQRPRRPDGRRVRRVEPAGRRLGQGACGAEERAGLLAAQGRPMAQRTSPLQPLAPAGEERRLEPASRPLLFQQWLPMALVGAGVLLLVVAGVVDAASVRIIASALAGMILTVGGALFTGSWYVRRQRRRIRDRIETRMPPISPSSRNR